MTWRLVTRDQTTAGNIPVQITNIQHATEWKLNDGSWQPYSVEQPITVAAGEYQLYLRQYRDGVALSWSTTLTANDDAPIQLNPDFRAQSVRVTWRDIPERGIVIRNGVTMGITDSLTFRAAGRYSIALIGEGITRWTQVTVDGSGSATASWQITDWPPAEAYFATTTGDGRSVALHHPVSWLEVDRAARNSGLRDSQWTQPLRPEEPASALPFAYIQAWESAAAPHQVRLPTRAEAEELSGMLRRGAWYRDGGRLYFYGSPQATTAIIVAVPAS